MIVTFDAARNKYHTFSNNNLTVAVKGYTYPDTNSYIYLTRGKIPNGKYYFEIDQSFVYHQNPYVELSDSTNPSKYTRYDRITEIGIYGFYIDTINKIFKIVSPSGKTSTYSISLENVEFRLLNVSNSGTDQCRFTVIGNFSGPFVKPVDKGYSILGIELAFHVVMNSIKYSLTEVDGVLTPVVLSLADLEIFKQQSMKDTNSILENIDKFEPMMQNKKFKIGLMKTE